jgi:hypothetical protein
MVSVHYVGEGWWSKSAYIMDDRREREREKRREEEESVSRGKRDREGGRIPALIQSFLLMSYFFIHLFTCAYIV